MTPLALLVAFAMLTAPDSDLARSVTIYRDAWGVPHVFGATNASTAFGLGYAQAEDNFLRIEANYIAALGRNAEVFGEPYVEEDRLTRTLDIPALARAEYGRLDAEMRAICDGFAAGVNYYLARHPETHPRLLAHVEPWYALAFIRYNYYVAGFVRDRKLGVPFPIAAGYFDHFTPTANGSNGWVIGPSKSATGHAMLLINPHLPYFGIGQVYEAHIHSDAGWEFTGYTRFGFPLLYVGHNADVGWVSTDNAADVDNGYVEHFNDPVHPLAYRYGTGYRTATLRTEEIRVRTASGMAVRSIRVLTTHHGPVVASLNGNPVAVRLAKLDADGWLREWYDMSRAHSVAELKRAMAPLNMLFGNVMAADRGGNTWYLYNGAVPQRDTQFDWTHPVDGSDPRTEWHGFHPIDALPQLTNPATGWMQNCNSAPFLLTSAGNPDPARFPSYMVREGPSGDNPRAHVSRVILGSTARFTFDEWERAAFDAHVITADSLVPLLIADVRRAGDARLDSAVALLQGWDHRATTTSVAMTIYSTWHQLARTSAPAAALGAALDTLSRAFGHWAVAWGDANRLARPDDREAPPFDGPPFSDTTSSIAVPGANGYDGVVLTINPAGRGARHYAVHGATYVSVVEFGPTVRAESVHIFGASGDPRSPHYFDQAAMIARGEMKPVWFTRAEVEAHAAARYHPGAERSAATPGPPTPPTR